MIGAKSNTIGNMDLQINEVISDDHRSTETKKAKKKIKCNKGTSDIRTCNKITDRKKSSLKWEVGDGHDGGILQSYLQTSVILDLF